MTKDWRRIGEVTVVAYNESVTRFDSLEAAVRFIGRHGIDHVGDKAYLGWFFDDIVERRARVGKTLRDALNSVRFNNTGLSYGETYIIYDELGLRIPSWRIKYAYDNLPNVKGRPYHVWGRNRFRSRSSHHPRTFGLQQSFAVSAEVSEECAELGIRIRNRRSESLRIDPWDDYHYPAWKHRSWKDYRRTQHKAG